MPRFTIATDFSSPGSFADGISPSMSGANGGSIGVRQLSCLSPCGRTVLSLDVASCAIKAHNLPLAGSTEKEIDRDVPAIVQISLPERVRAAFRMSPAVELLCVESDAVPSSPNPRLCLLPLLSIYSQKCVFLMRLAFPRDFSSAAPVVEGQIVSLTEPFEAALLSPSTSTSIIRVRASPQRRMGYVTMCPSGSMAMLTHNTSTREYRLDLYHASESEQPLLRTPLQFAMEDLAESHQFTDFCFAQSNALSLLANMTIHLLKASGELFAANPILFDGAVVPLAAYRESLDYVHDLMQVLSKDEYSSESSKWRQSRAARRFLSQAFPETNVAGQFITACVGRGGLRDATLWPAQLQGPVLMRPLMDPEEEQYQALSIEPFFARDLVGFVIGRQGGGVDFGASPPSAILPRSSYEASADRPLLDDELGEMGAIVERLGVEFDKENEDPSHGMVNIVRDPVMPTMTHFMSSQGIITVTTNSLEIFSGKLRKDRSGALSPQNAKSKVSSVAWPSVNVSSTDGKTMLVGAVVSPDALLGHTLIASLTDGTLHPINLTESRYARDASILLEEEAELGASGKDEALKVVEGTPPFSEVIQPIVENVQNGLNNRLGKIIGAATPQQEIDPGTLATVLEVKKKCERDVIQHLKELKRLCSSRMSELKQVGKAQVVQLQSLREKHKLLQEKLAANTKSVESLEENTKDLARRSNKILQASHDLFPGITTAEEEYFRVLEGVALKCDQWESQCNDLRQACQALCTEADNGLLQSTTSLSREEVANAHSLLHGQDDLLAKCSERVTTTERMIQDLMNSMGMSNNN